MKPCSHCRGQNRDEARFCGHCGRPFVNATSPQQRLAEENVGQAPNPRLSPLLSCLWPGLGQLYNRQVLKGATFIITQCCLWPLSFAFSNVITELLQI